MLEDRYLKLLNVLIRLIFSRKTSPTVARQTRDNRDSREVCRQHRHEV